MNRRRKRSKLDQRQREHSNMMMLRGRELGHHQKTSQRFHFCTCVGGSNMQLADTQYPSNCLPSAIVRQADVNLRGGF